MTKKKINAAKAAAHEFIKRANEVLDEQKTYENAYFSGGSKATAALRRQSMELTRALSDLRR